VFTIPVSVIATRQQIGPAHAHSRRDKGKARSADDEHTDPEKADAVDNDTSEPDMDDSFLGVAREIIREEGVTGLWLGIKPSLVLTVNPAITYGAYERVKGLMLAAREKAGAPGAKLGPWSAFMLGALSKTLATIVRIFSLRQVVHCTELLAIPQVTYPYIMAKVRIQARTADAEGGVLSSPAGYNHKTAKHPGAVDILKRVWQQQGPLGWYQVS
jgi:solute carrier family 25 (peroxisomal adenine nucleotide transporter), member 17